MQSAHTAVCWADLCCLSLIMAQVVKPRGVTEEEASLVAALSAQADAIEQQWRQLEADQAVFAREREQWKEQVRGSGGGLLPPP